jgi:hypothetical protein
LDEKLVNVTVTPAKPPVHDRTPPVVHDATFRFEMVILSLMRGATESVQPMVHVTRVVVATGLLEAAVTLDTVPMVVMTTGMVAATAVGLR